MKTIPARSFRLSCFAGKNSCWRLDSHGRKEFSNSCTLYWAADDIERFNVQ